MGKSLNSVPMTRDWSSANWPSSVRPISARGVNWAPSRPRRGPDQRLDGGVILGVVGIGGEMHGLACLADFAPAFDQRLMDAVELVGIWAKDARFLLLFEPQPLERGGSVKRRRRIRIVFQQLRPDRCRRQARSMRP